MRLLQWDQRCTAEARFRPQSFLGNLALLSLVHKSQLKWPTRTATENLLAHFMYAFLKYYALFIYSCLLREIVSILSNIQMVGVNTVRCNNSVWKLWLFHSKLWNSTSSIKRRSYTRINIVDTEYGTDTYTL